MHPSVGCLGIVRRGAVCQVGWFCGGDAWVVGVGCVVFRSLGGLASDTTSACCVTEPNDGNPRGSVKGVCNTPLHAVTEYVDFV